MEKEILQLLKDLLSCHAYDLSSNNTERIENIIKELEQEPVAHILFSRLLFNDGSEIYDLKRYLKPEEYDYEILKNVKLD